MVKQLRNRHWCHSLDSTVGERRQDTPWAAHIWSQHTDTSAGVVTEKWTKMKSWLLASWRQMRSSQQSIVLFSVFFEKTNRLLWVAAIRLNRSLIRLWKMTPNPCKIQLFLVNYTYSHTVFAGFYGFHADFVLVPLLCCFFFSRCFDLLAQQPIVGRFLMISSANGQ